MSATQHSTHRRARSRSDRHLVNQPTIRKPSTLGAPSAPMPMWMASRLPTCPPARLPAFFLSIRIASGHHWAFPWILRRRTRGCHHFQLPLRRVPLATRSHRLPLVPLLASSCQDQACRRLIRLRLPGPQLRASNDLALAVTRRTRPRKLTPSSPMTCCHCNTWKSTTGVRPTQGNRTGQRRCSATSTMTAASGP